MSCAGLCEAIGASILQPPLRKSAEECGQTVSAYHCPAPPGKAANPSAVRFRFVPAHLQRCPQPKEVQKEKLRATLANSEHRPEHSSIPRCVDSQIRVNPRCAESIPSRSHSTQSWDGKTTKGADITHAPPRP